MRLPRYAVYIILLLLFALALLWMHAGLGEMVRDLVLRAFPSLFEPQVTEYQEIHTELFGTYSLAWPLDSVT